MNIRTLASLVFIMIILFFRHNATVNKHIPRVNRFIKNTHAAPVVYMVAFNISCPRSTTSFLDMLFEVQNVNVVG